MGQNNQNDTFNIVIGAAIVIFLLWLLIKFIGFIIEHRVIFGLIAVALAIAGFFLVKSLKNKG